MKRVKTNRLRRKLLTVAVAACFSTELAYANPVGPAVVNGQATFASQGRLLSVTNTPGAIINWQQFSIQASEATRFIQQSAASAVLNRVVGVDPSSILGALQSNGRVFLVNPNGILFGAGARIDVAGLVASTLNLTNQDFLAGRMNFIGDPGSAAAIVNQGRIAAAEGGRVYLVGSAVDNQGVITAPNGDIVLAAGKSVRVMDSPTAGLQVEITAKADSTLNLSELTYGSRGIYAGLVTNRGTINADSVVRGADGRIMLKGSNGVRLAFGSSITANGLGGGRVVIDAQQGTVEIAGKVEATGSSGSGGSIAITGSRTELYEGASVDASGATAGGTVLIGGDDRGAQIRDGDLALANSSVTYIAPSAQIAADALESGDGGHIVIWGDEITRYYGTISARGGPQGGNGGQVETSGKSILTAQGNVDASAPLGKAGIWLLDPNNITIQAAGVETNVTASPTFTSTNDTAIVTTGSIQAALNAGTSVSVTTAAAGANTQAGNITVASSISKTAGGDATLTLSAKNDITVNAGVAISSTTGKLHVVLGADSDGIGGGAIVMTNGSSITSLGGNITLGGGTNPGGLVNGLLPFTGATGNATNINGISSGAVLDAGGGNIWLMGTGHAGAAGADVGITLLTGSNLQTSGTGNITLTGNGGGTGGNNNWGVSLFGTTIQTSGSGAITVTGTAGNVGAGTDSYGVVLQSTSTIQTTGTGDITVWGHGANTTGGTGNFGVYITPTSTVHAIGAGVISLTGYSGNNGLGVGVNHGVDVQGLVAGGGSPIFITGTAGNSYGNFNFGIRVRGTVSNIGSGTITMVGAGGGNPASMGTGNFGIGLSRGTISAVDGTITVTGTGGNSGGPENEGVRLNSGSGFGLNTIKTTGSGNIVITGIQGPGGLGFDSTLFNSNVVQTTGTGSITLITDSINIAIVNAINSATGLTLRPYTSGTSIGVGTGAGGGLNINDTKLGFMNWASTNYLTIGGSTAGALTINTAYSFAKPVTFISGGASDITIAGQLTSTSTGAGTPNAAAVVLGAGRNFINTVGATAFNLASGRWLIYSTNPAADTRAGLVYNFKQYNATYGVTPVLGTGNGFLYSLAPSVTAGIIGVTTKVYDGTTAATLAAGNYSVSGTIDGDTATLNNPSSGSYDTRNVGTNENVSVSGLSVLSATNGAAAVYGYQVAGTANANIGAITARPITIASQAGQSKTYGNDDPASAKTAYALSGGTSLGTSDSLSGNMGRTSGEVVGNYTYTPGSATVSDGNSGNNYSITFDGTTNRFQINTAALTGSIANQSKVYGADDPSLAAIAVTLGGVVNRTAMDMNGNDTVINDTGNVATSLATLTRVTGETVAASPYSITGGTLNVLSGSAAGNYSAASLSTAGNALAITAAGLSIQADDQARAQGVTNPPFTASYTGFKLSETPAVLGGALSLTTPAIMSSPVGTYAITPAGQTSSNYAITYINGMLVVGSPPILLPQLSAGFLDGLTSEVLVGLRRLGIGDIDELVLDCLAEGGPASGALKGVAARTPFGCGPADTQVSENTPPTP